MASKRLLTIFTATGNQGSSVINTILAHSSLSHKYALRGITRNKTSEKSKALTSRGVEMVEANLDNRASIAAAVKGSYGVFLNTDYWTVLDKDKETQQGKAIFDSCKEAGVHHVVLSALPNVSKLSSGKYKGVAHFDSKAIVGEYAEANKGSMIVSYLMPAMYMENIKQVAQDVDGAMIISLPFSDPDFAWPMITPSRDTGKYAVGLFEAGDAANGVAVHGVSAWTTPNKVAQVLAKHLDKDVQFKSVTAKQYEQYLPEQIRDELSEMMQWIGESSYYGKGSEKDQAESDKWIVKGENLTSWEEFVKLEF